MASHSNSDVIFNKLAEYAVPSDTATIESRVTSIPSDLVLKPNMSIGIYLQEAFNLCYYAQADKEVLCSKGLDWRLMEEFPRRISFVCEQETKWYSARYCETPSEKELKKLHAIVDVSRKELLASMKYAFEGSNLVKAVKYIEKGEGSADYAQDLWDIVNLAENHIESLQAIGCDCHHIEVLNNNKKTYSELIAKCALEDADRNDALDNRNRAYTFLAVAVEFVRRTAQYALWNDKKRLRGYASEYFRRTTRKAANIEKVILQ